MTDTIGAIARVASPGIWHMLDEAQNRGRINPAMEIIQQMSLGNAVSILMILHDTVTPEMVNEGADTFERFNTPDAAPSAAALHIFVAMLKAAMKETTP